MTRVEKFYSGLIMYGIVVLSVPLSLGAHLLDAFVRAGIDTIEQYAYARNRIATVDKRLREQRGKA